MDEQKDRKRQQGRRTKPGPYITKKKKQKDFIIAIDDKYISDPNKFGMNDIVIMNPEKKAKGGRAGLKGGGICKRGMNRQAIGKNS